MTNSLTLNEAAAVDKIREWFGIIQERMASPYSREWLETVLRDHLQQGLVEMLRVVEWADAGDEIADSALRHVYGEMRNRREEPPVVLEAYILKTLARGAVTRGRGHQWYDDWRRNIGIAVLVHLTCVQFNLKPSRNREQKRRQQPSGSSIVSSALGNIALGQSRIIIAERRIESIWREHHDNVAAYVVTYLTRRP